jgi:hypothetical protein
MASMMDVYTVGRRPDLKTNALEQRLASMTEIARMVEIEARPQPLTLNPAETAVIVVDMQNDFVADGGMFARAGLPVSAAQAVIEPTARILAAARASGMKVVYLKMEFESDLSNLGRPDAPNRVRTSPSESARSSRRQMAARAAC